MGKVRNAIALQGVAVFRLWPVVVGRLVLVVGGVASVVLVVEFVVAVRKVRLVVVVTIAKIENREEERMKVAVIAACSVVSPLDEGRNMSWASSRSRARWTSSLGTWSWLGSGEWSWVGSWSWVESWPWSWSRMWLGSWSKIERRRRG